MPVGTVKFFNPTKNFGFVIRDDGQPDEFPGGSILARMSVLSVKEGDRLDFEVGTSPQTGRAQIVKFRILQQ
jgi:cold shock CspA family protein